MSFEIGGRQIHFGLWYDFRNPPQWNRPTEELYARTLDHIAYAERLGFDNIWTSEHHFIEDGYSPSLLPICAAIAARTTRARIGTNILLLPFHDPLRLAEDAATVDVISGGRFDLGVAVGYKLEEFEGFQVPRRERASRMEEAVEVIRAAWAPGTFSFEGRHFRYTRVNVTPKPVQEPMPLWFGGFSEPAVRRAARLGDGLLAAANVIPTYVDELQRLGKPAPERIAIALPWALIAEDTDAAWEEIGEHVLYQRANYARWFAAAGTPIFGEVPGSTDEIRERSPDIIVTPQRAREIIEGIVERLPVSHLYWWAIPPGVHPKATYESMELFARHVVRA
ncbi:MAG TPA: LLM class flavin-dependent oxidoreductase [Tepidiformaceae bacterium]|nr:LLM class flavin-dependent oxidoreductase [Tepidiformaceae bacterium]